MSRKCSLLLGFIVVLTGAHPVLCQSVGNSLPSDYAVYNALLGILQFPKANPHIVISDLTLNSGCGESSGNLVRMNDCGIWMQTDSAKSVGELLEKSWPQLDDIAWNDFAVKNSSSTKLQDDLKTSWIHKLIDIATDKSLAQPLDGLLLLSRVGFNKTKDEAVVYSLFLSYMQGVPTSGNFFLFTRNGAGSWSPAGRVTYMETQ